MATRMVTADASIQSKGILKARLWNATECVTRVGEIHTCLTPKHPIAVGVLPP